MRGVSVLSSREVLFAPFLETSIGMIPFFCFDGRRDPLGRIRIALGALLPKRAPA